MAQENTSEEIDLIIKSKIKSMCPDMSVAAEVADELNKKVKQILDSAVERAKANGRRTVQARDL